jgi:hypothetical protein
VIGQFGASNEAQQKVPATLQIRLGRTMQIFNTLDPYPFVERDLDPAAEDYLVAWAKELPDRRPLRIEVLVPAEEAGKLEALELPKALRAYFTRRAEAAGQELGELFRTGRIALLIGIPILVICFTLAKILNSAYDDEGFAAVAAEGLVIAGWVANWRPIEIFLYDWWPLMRRRRRFERLADAQVEVVRPPAL